MNACPQPCMHLSAEDAREGKTCPEHPCTCTPTEGAVVSTEAELRMALDTATEEFHVKLTEAAEAERAFKQATRAKDAAMGALMRHLEQRLRKPSLTTPEKEAAQDAAFAARERHHQRVGTHIPGSQEHIGQLVYKGHAWRAMDGRLVGIRLDGSQFFMSPEFLTTHPTRDTW